ncbi:uncharacterized protein LOC106134117 [Amyelois transitella]|uniref:uncharacterized protein LOC106134117 n=1 Tax=Amyelois transitella TaxID=680683 RepID=UPI00067B79ED|nr:unnamed protein product [Amyelois transitella]XP_060801564.1 uncharacterized protein LOC106134117 [Amyelois transitella]
MACTRGLCMQDKIFIFINIAFAMFSGALLATAARLAWDPSTYAWFRFLCETQYRVTLGYVLAAGLWLAALVYLAAAATAYRAKKPDRNCLKLYAVGVVVLAISEVVYGAWMAASLKEWWETDPHAELARKSMRLMEDVKPALLAVKNYRDVVEPVLDMLEEVERKAPNNVFVIVVFAMLGLVLQIAAFVMACRLSRRAPPRAEPRAGPERRLEKGAPSPLPGDDSDDSRADMPPGWRKKANLSMYTILDRIF